MTWYKISDVYHDEFNLLMSVIKTHVYYQNDLFELKVYKVEFKDYVDIYLETSNCVFIERLEVLFPTKCMMPEVNLGEPVFSSFI